jgi:chromate transporter
MGAVTWRLGRVAIVDGPTGVLALLGALLVLRFRVNSSWLILGAGGLGLLFSRV